MEDKIKQMRKLPAEPYNSKSPHSGVGDCFRTYKKSKDMAYTNSITKKQLKKPKPRMTDPTDVEAVDPKMLHQPDWRQHDKTKWVGKRDFLPQSKANTELLPIESPVVA